MDFNGKRVVVVGLGKSGIAAARACRSRGADVVGVDVRESLGAEAMESLRGITLELGPHRRERFTQSDLVVVSPGVPSTQPDVCAAEEAGVPVWGELQLGAELLASRDPVFIGVTGTNGKSTVTSFVGQLLTELGDYPFVGGNLGTPLCAAVESPHPFQPYVTECSSYQLERVGQFRARVGVFLNLTPDHLARHGTMEAYGLAKAKMFDNAQPSDLMIIPSDPSIVDLIDTALAGRPVRRALLGKDIVVRGSLAEIALQGQPVRAINLSSLSVPGAHNLQNAAVACAVALELGHDPTAVEAAVAELRALSHRMEIVAEGPVLWINDSKATNVAAAQVGLTGMDRPCVVLLGGKSKGDGFSALVPDLDGHRAVVCFGQDGPSIADELGELRIPVIRVGSMREAVHAAYHQARAGDAVLLSPGCASFDEFDHFEHRGEVFRETVHALLAEPRTGVSA